MSNLQRIGGVVAVLLVLGGIIWGWDHFFRIPHNDSGDSHGISDTGAGAAEKIENFDQLQEAIQGRVRTFFKDDADFTVIPAIAAYPIGTLVRASGSVPADSEDCLPKNAPPASPMPHIFPAFSLSTETAFNANIGSAVLRNLESAGVDLKRSTSVNYSIEEAQIQMMDDRSVESLAGQGPCRAYIASHEGVKLVRGTVLGKVSFTLKVDSPATVKAQLARFADIKLSDNPQSSTVSVADSKGQAIVQLLSAFRSSSPATAPQPKPVAAAVERDPASVPNPAPGPVQAHIYIQLDKTDRGSDATVYDLLRRQWPEARVEPHVEHIPTAKMPETPQVRYFNSDDIDKARKCVALLQPYYPKVQAVRIGLPSPKGQLEVWGAKAGSGGLTQ